MANALAGGLLLFWRFEQKLLDVSGSQALGQIVEGAVFFSLVAVAIGFAAFSESFDEGSAHQVRMNRNLSEQSGLALAQGQSGAASGGVYPSHIYG